MKTLYATFLCLLTALLLAINTATAQGAWTVKAPITDTARTQSSAFAMNGKLYFVGGSIAGVPTADVWEYNPATNTWTAKNPIPFTPRQNFVALTIGNRAFVGLGLAAGSTYLADWWEYMGSTDTWIARAALPDTGRTSVGSFVVGGKGYVVGGSKSGANNFSDDLWEYDTATNAWTSRAPVPTGPRTAPRGFAIGSNGYIMGGSGVPAPTTYGDLWMYTPSSNTWTSKAALPSGARGSHVAFAIDTAGYMGLGNSGTPPASTQDSLFYRYSPTANTWTAVAPAPNRRAGATHVVSGGKGYVFGGTQNNMTGTIFTTLWEYNPAPANVVCDTTTSLLVSGITSSSATINWGAVSGATSYQWIVNTSAAAPVTGTTVTTPGALATALMPGTVYWAHVRTVCGNTNSAWKSRSFSTMPTSIMSAPEATGVKLWPNPVTNAVHVELPADDDIVIADVAGRTIRTLHLKGGLNTINVADLSIGIYVIRGNGWVSRIVKE